MTRFLETRKGFTLTEVLMAMFVMAIGMLSLLALFPVAFHNAKWALDTEQVARGAANAQSTSELPRVRVVDPAVGIIGSTSHSVRNDDRYAPRLSNGSFFLTNATPMGPMLGRRDFLVNVITNPAAPTWTFSTNINYPLPILPPATALLMQNAKVKLPPVFVDPQVADSFIDTFNGTLLPMQVGCSQPADSPFASSTPGNSFATNVDLATLRPRKSLGIPRSSSSQYSTDPLGLTKQLETTMGDEIDFGPNGQPLINSAGSYARQRRFTWAYMCHWPDYANNDICEVTAVIFNSRPTNSGLATVPPGEKTYEGNNQAAVAAGTDTFGFGRIFVKGFTQATIYLGTTPTPLSLKANDWILDSTLILPEYDNANPASVAPFLDMYNRDAFFQVPTGSGTVNLRPGLVGGHFYKVIDISEVRQCPSGYYQTITLDRPARSDGFSATVMSGIADVITKGAGKMPQR
jgi:prepilin-type N-terminal cleavage/methylation domain-containing protein